jgi:hypothetical protein
MVPEVVLAATTCSSCGAARKIATEWMAECDAARVVASAIVLRRPTGTGLPVYDVKLLFGRTVTMRNTIHVGPKRSEQQH